MDGERPFAVVLTGPTATGKTAVAVALVAAGPFEIVSADSAMVYRGMDIGTAKPDADVLARAPHRLIDICDPDEVYSAARFRQDALAALAAICDAGRIPLVVGGTMLYLRALTQGLAELPPADPEIRAQLERDMAQSGLAVLHRRLARVDPPSAARIHANDTQRTLRALEVWEVTGTPLSVLLRDQARLEQEHQPYQWYRFAMPVVERQVLHERIERRFRAMLEAGFEDEVRRLMARPGFDADWPSMRAVGYRQLIGHLRGEYDRDTMVARALAATRQLAKRQSTWLRSEPDLRALSAEGLGAAQEIVRFLTKIKA